MRGKQTLAAAGLVSALGIGSTACSGKVVVTPLAAVPAAPKTDGEKRPMNGVFYALPRTVVSVTATLKRTDRKPGPFTPYVEVFFPGLKTVGKEETVFDLQSVSLRTYGEPDPNRAYLVEYPDSKTIDRAGNFRLRADGLLTAAEGVRAEDRTADVVFAAVESVVDIAGMAKIFMMGKGPIDFAAAATLSQKEQETVDAFLKACGLPGETRRNALRFAAEKAVFRVMWAAECREQGERHVLRDAGAAFVSILDLQAARRALLADPATEGIETRLAAIDEALKAAAQAFAGKEPELELPVLLDVRPPAGQNKGSAELFPLNREAGLCLADAPSSLVRLVRQPPPKAVAPKSKCANAQPVTLTWEAEPDQIATRASAHYAVPSEASFRYVIPARTRFAISWPWPDLKPIDIPELLIAQLGTVGALPAKLGGKATEYSLSIDEASGAINSVKLAGKGGLDAAAVKQAGGTLASVLEDREKRREEERAAADELATLERRRKLLEEQVKIREACAKLGIDCGT